MKNQQQIKLTRIIIICCLGLICNYSAIGQFGENGKAFRANGNISLGGFIYSADGLTPRQPSEGYSITAQMNISLYGISIPLYASINEQGSRFENPFNRFGISPHYKWAKLHLGWRNMQFSQFTLQGVSFLGGGMELTPGKWRIAGMYGRFQEATDGSDRNYFGPRFERKGWAAKLGYGSALNFFELNLFKAKDDISTLELGDTLNVNAHENLCLGMTSNFQIIPKYLKAGIEVGLSGFTEDLRSDTLPSEAERYIEGIAWAYEPNISSHFNYALESFLTLSVKGFQISGNYRRIMPEYQTLGTNYLLNDVEAITIQPSYRSKSGKWSLNTSFGTQKNNLDGWRQNQNNRWIGSAQLQYNPSPFIGINAQYSNYSFTQQVLRDSINQDSFQLNQINQNIVITPRFIFQRSAFNHVLILNYNTQELADRSQIESLDASNNMHLMHVNYTLSQKSNKARYSLGANYFKFNSTAIITERWGINLGYRQPFFKNKLSANINAGYQQSVGSDDYHYYMGLSSRLKLYKKLSLTLQSRLRNAQRSGKAQREIRTEIRIRQQF